MLLGKYRVDIGLWEMSEVLHLFFRYFGTRIKRTRRAYCHQDPWSMMVDTEDLGGTSTRAGGNKTSISYSGIKLKHASCISIKLPLVHDEVQAKVENLFGANVHCNKSTNYTLHDEVVKYITNIEFLIFIDNLSEITVKVTVKSLVL